MNIIINNSPTKYGDLHQGDVFRYNSCYYMKTDDKTGANVVFSKAINLKNGALHIISDEEIVELCNAKLYIE